MNASKNISFDTSKALKCDLVKKARAYSMHCHSSTNHLYDGKPYYVNHILPVVSYVIEFKHLLNSQEDFELAIASAFTHDIIEDCRETYNDVKNATSLEVAEITYALTNEKGKTRKERASDSYYDGIVNTHLAGFIKMCDRLANVYYSRTNKSRMIEMYRKENDEFVSKLQSIGYKPMFEELEKLLST